jgi:hypothetical protein
VAPVFSLWRVESLTSWIVDKEVLRWDTQFRKVILIVAWRMELQVTRKKRKGGSAVS